MDLKSFYNQKSEKNVPWTYIISDLNEEEIFGTFYQKELQKANQFIIGRIIKKKDSKLFKLNISN